MAIDEIYYYDDVNEEVSPVKCLITDLQNDVHLLNATQNISMYDYRYDDDRFRIDNITEETSTEYQIFVESKDYCRTLNVTLRKIELATNESCEANLERTHEAQDTDAYSGQLFRLYCDAPDDSPNTPRNLIEEAEFGSMGAKARWLFDCRVKLPNNSYISKEHILSLKKIQYYNNPGVYTCAVEYNGMTRYRTHYNLCIEPRNSLILTATCNSQVAKIGSKVSVECYIDAGVGATQVIGFQGYFEKVAEQEIDREEYFCHSKFIDPRTNHRISCKSTRKPVPGIKCFSTIPTEEELRNQTTAFTFVYTIR